MKFKFRLALITAVVIITVVALLTVGDSSTLAKALRALLGIGIP